MTKFQLNRADAPWDYPSLGFRADTDDAILDGSLSTPAITTPPDAYWSVYVGGSAETGITRYGSPTGPDPATETAEGSTLMYEDSSNRFVPKTAEEFFATEAVADVLTASIDGRAKSPDDALPNEHPFWYVTRPQSINGRVYASTAGDNADVYLQEWTQPEAGGPMWLRRYLLGYVGVGTVMDDHALAGLAVEPGQPLTAFWCGHSFDNVILYRSTLKAIDAYAENETLTFGEIQRFEIPADEAVSYCQVMIHGDDIWVLVRTGNPVTRWSLVKFPDWATGTPVQYELLSSIDQFYAVGRIVGDVIRIQVADHPDHATDNKLWYCAVNVVTGAVTEADGTVLGNLDGTNLPLAEASLEELFTATGTEKPWVFDVGYDTAPELVFTSGRQAPNFGATGDYLYAKYTGGSWVINTICPVGTFMVAGGAYFPSITFDPTTAGAVYLVREEDGVHYLERRVTADNGATWTTTVIDTYEVGTSYPNVEGNTVPTLSRAFPVERPDGETPLFDVLATEIDYYPTYTDWVSRFRPMPQTLVTKRLPDDLAGYALTTTDAGLYLDGASGSYILGEDVDVPAGAVRLEVDVALDDWASGSDQNLIAKESSTSTRSVRLVVAGNGKLQVYWSEDGSVAKQIPTTAALGFADGQRAEVGVVFIPSYDATHYWVNFIKRMPGEHRWTKIEGFSPAASNTSIFDSTSPWEVGSRRLGTTERAAGTFYRASVLTRGEQLVTEWRPQDKERGTTYRDRNRHAWVAQGMGLVGSAWNDANVMRRGSIWEWYNSDGNLIRKVGSAPTSDSDGRLVADAVIPADLATTLGLLDSGESTTPRLMSAPLPTAWTSGSLRLSYFTARKAETINNVVIHTGSVAAAATPTLCRVGLYQVDGSGNLTLVASIANDTTLFAAAGTIYTRALSAPFAKVAGQRYAIGVLVVSGATMPTFTGVSIASNESRMAPAMTGALAGQTDLPASVTVGSLSASGSMVHVSVTP